jgi:hypothetical protein
MPNRDPTLESARLREYRRRKHRELLANHHGGMPILRPAYTAVQRAALHALAESNPTPQEYATQRAAILGTA